MLRISILSIFLLLSTLSFSQDDKKQALEEYKLGLDMAKDIVKDITTNE